MMRPAIGARKIVRSQHRESRVVSFRLFCDVPRLRWFVLIDAAGAPQSRQRDGVSPGFAQFSLLLQMQFRRVDDREPAPQSLHRIFSPNSLRAPLPIMHAGCWTIRKALSPDQQPEVQLEFLAT